MTAPFGRRRVPVTAAGAIGAHTIVTVVDEDGPRPEPGQFYMLAAAERWGGGEDERPFLPRAFSHMRVHADNRLDFVLHEVGPGTRRLAELESGDEVWLLGPLGHGFRPARSGRRPILVGGGVGIAPITALKDELGATALVLLGFRDAAHAAVAERVPGARLATDDGSAGHQGLVTDLLCAELGCDPRAEVFACGPHGMLEAVRVLCAELGVPAQLAMEAGMACGYGACFGCVVPTRDGYVRLCLEGPVLDAAEVLSCSAPAGVAA